MTTIIILFCVGAMVSCCAIAGAQPASKALYIAPDKIGMESDARTLAAKMTVGWNLGNALEAIKKGVARETAWGNPPVNKALIDAVKVAGFNTIRIPCAWDGYIENNTTYIIKASWLARVKEVVDYAIDNNMYTIINIHWDGGWLEEHPLYSHQAAVNKKQKALWEQIAICFRNYDERLLFAGTNEVRANYDTPTAENIAVQESYNQTFVDAVRSTGGKNTWRQLIVQSYNTNMEHAVNFMTMPADPTPNRIMSEVHFYDPWDFAGKATGNKYLWGAGFAGNPHTDTVQQEAWVDEIFGRVKTKFVDKNIPVILGEYGAIYRSSLTGTALVNHRTARNAYLAYVTKAAKRNGIVPVYWDNGFTGNNGFGLFDRKTAAVVHKDALNAIINAAK